MRSSLTVLPQLKVSLHYPVKYAAPLWLTVNGLLFCEPSCSSVSQYNTAACTSAVILPWTSPSTKVPLKKFLANCASDSQLMHDSSACFSVISQRLRSNSDSRAPLTMKNMSTATTFSNNKVHKTAVHVSHPTFQWPSTWWTWASCTHLVSSSTCSRGKPLYISGVMLFLCYGGTVVQQVLGSNPTRGKAV